MLPLETIANQISICANCKVNQLPNRPGPCVPGLSFSKAEAALMLLGEAPGYEEPLKGLPFVGPAGRLLQRNIRQAKLDLSKLFITNVLKHRPPNNRNPSSDEIAACLPFLLEQIKITRPKAILCLGKIASYTIASLAHIELPSTGVRGKRFTLKLFDSSIQIICTWHPSYALRNQDNPNIQNELLLDLIAAYKEGTDESK